jgi:hypothetical protein
MSISPAITMITTKIIATPLGIRTFTMSDTKGFITRAKSRAMVNGKITTAVIFSTAAVTKSAINATRNRTALPELMLLNGFLI